MTLDDADYKNCASEGASASAGASESVREFSTESAREFSAESACKCANAGARKTKNPDLSNIPKSHIDIDAIEDQRNVSAAYAGWIESVTLKSSPHKLTGKLINALGSENVLEHEFMRKHTTFKIGGPADVMVLPHTVEQIKQVVELCNENDVQYRVMGLGSNILVCDEGIECVVIKLAENFADIRVSGCNVYAQAGASNEDVAKAALDAGLSGFEFACGIPGSVGGGAIMNAGAYDGEFSQVCTSVDCLTPDGMIKTLSAKEARWGYRHSFMMDAEYIVTGVKFSLARANKHEIEATMKDLQTRRRNKQPLDMPSAGSTFKRPEGFYAAALIQESDMQGHTCGGACVSNKHAGFVVNANNATAKDVCHVIKDVQDEVYKRSGVLLEPEVRMWGF